DVLAELNEVIATQGAKEMKDDDNDPGNVSGGVKRKQSPSCAAATETEFEQQALFEETLVESAVQTPVAEQTVEAAAPPEASELESDEAIDSTAGPETPEQPNQGTLLVDATCAPADVAYPTDLNLLNEAR